jgi:hypothetical protein
MCSPVRASQVAHALKLPRVSVLRRLQEMVKHGYVERIGNAYRVTDKVNIPDLQTKLQRRINMVTETAKRLGEVAAAIKAGNSLRAGPIARPRELSTIYYKRFDDAQLRLRALNRAPGAIANSVRTFPLLAMSPTNA